MLGDYFSFPGNFKKLFNDIDSALNSIFKISLAPNKMHRSNFTCEMVSYTASKVVGITRGKKIAERSRKELAGSDFEEFIDSIRYETIVKRTPQILVFKMIFDNPWNVSVTYTDVL